MEQYRYSPLPLSAYGRCTQLGSGSIRVGPSSMGGITEPAWNLIWLSVPAVDLYLDPSVPYEDIPSIGEAVGTARAVVSSEWDEFLPGFREALMGPPKDLITYATHKLDWSVVPELYLEPGWVDTVCARAWEAAMRLTPAPTPPQVKGNVIYGNFGVRRA